jgi:chemotaxis protein CheD
MSEGPSAPNGAVASSFEVDDASGAGGGLRVYLQPGQIVVSAQACRVTTILGSCVAVALYDATQGLGGINHYLLPRGPRDSDSARFGQVALPRLLREILALGADRRRLVAKVFGGSCVLGNHDPGRRDIGRQNVDAALEFLAAERIPVAASDTGGTQGRKLVFRTADGVVWLKSL